jgi:hypothetical protein
MKRHSWQLPALAVLAACRSVGCGPGAFVVEAKYPTEPTSLEPDSGLTFRIGRIEDARSFEEWTDKISQPVYQGTEPTGEQRPRIAGVKTTREGIEHIVLGQDQTLERIMGHMLGAAFRQAGHRQAKEGEEADLVVDATVERFWLWMTPDAMTIRIECTIQASVTVSWTGGEGAFEAVGYEDSRDVSKSPESYKFTLQEALFGFYADLASKAIQLEVAEGQPSG